MAGVGAGQPVRDALFPVRRQEAGINTGVAVHNLGEEATRVASRLMQKGLVLEEVEIPLEAGGQEAQFIEEMFTGVAVELDAANRIFTTLPVVPIPERISRE